MNPNRDYTSYTFVITLLVIVLLAGISHLPAFNVAGTFIKRINILSDVLPREDPVPAKESAEPVFDTLLLAQAEAEALNFMDSSDVSASSDSGMQPNGDLTQQWNLGSGKTAVRETRAPADETALTPGGPAIEDYGEDIPALEAFYRVWDDSERNRPLRIAVLGDSFIEGDILTADLREQLQQICGGSGVGFVPFATAMSKFRASVLQQYDNWEISTLQQRSSLPEEMRDKFFISGSFATPGEGATTRLEGTRFKQYIERSDMARLLFINRGSTRLDVLINDSVSRSFTPPQGEQVQQIVINAPIHSIKVGLSQTEGFIGYGIILEDRDGVSVDNFSIRGNSGLALYGTNRSVNHQIAQLAGYDLIILQYGLNVMSADVTRYDYYGQKLVNVIRYMQQCFPASSILVMGVGDRSTQREGQFVTMPGVYGMISAQREAARQAGVAFWDTFEAMGGPGSMVHYVKNKWAAQDYTHIRHPGGRRIATKLAASLVTGRTQVALDMAERERRAEELRFKALQYETHLQEAIEPDSAEGTSPDSIILPEGTLSGPTAAKRDTARQSANGQNGSRPARKDSLTRPHGATAAATAGTAAGKTSGTTAGTTAAATAGKTTGTASATSPSATDPSGQQAPPTSTNTPATPGSGHTAPKESTTSPAETQSGPPAETHVVPAETLPATETTSPAGDSGSR